MLQQAISLIENDFHFRLSYILFIILGSNGRCTGQDKLIIRKSGSSLQHIRQIIFDFLFPATGKKSDNKVLLIFRMSCLIGCHLIHRRVSYIVNGVLMLSFEEFHFKRKNGEKLIYISFYILDTVFFPRPYLRRNIIVNRYLCLCVDKFGNIQIESRIIYQNDNIRIPGNDIFLATSHIGKDSTQMEQHRNKSHISQLLIMFHHRTAYGSHQITAEKTKFSLRIFHLRKNGNQPAGLLPLRQPSDERRASRRKFHRQSDNTS